MQVEYASRKAEKTFNKYLNGTEFSSKIERRILELEAAQDLSQIDAIKSLQLHKLSGKRKGQMSIACKGSWKIVFIAKVDFTQYSEVTEIELLDFVDYH
ncbi:MAG: Plasmid maintenance system killer protein [candidate division WS6 bacterium OLB20]|uniref:Plasmid maintenance system killer protein n=1 Tax=candidate division WS6 bacterium OLB20 TaxID=1617426 RepID=A0A136LYZ0_9BACT|nr:MAG: Plasmid maintenance system killer protein [candidate division WS6 bacterium OLB20]